MESKEKSGFIYVLTNESFHKANWIKIGYAEDVDKRFDDDTDIESVKDIIKQICTLKKK